MSNISSVETVQIDHHLHSHYWIVPMHLKVPNHEATRPTASKRSCVVGVSPEIFTHFRSWTVWPRCHLCHTSCPEANRDSHFLVIVTPKGKKNKIINPIIYPWITVWCNVFFFYGKTSLNSWARCSLLYVLIWLKHAKLFRKIMNKDAELQNIFQGKEAVFMFT